MFWLLLLFVLIPAVELYVLIQIGSAIGAGYTLLLILATGVLGSWLAKTQGLATWRALNERLASGQIPGRELMDGAIILVCGTLLLTPGVITDAIGLLGLVPVTRSAFRGALKKVFATIPTINMGFGAASMYNDVRGARSPKHTSPDSLHSTAPGTSGQSSKSSPQAQTMEGPIISGSPKSRPSHESAS